MLLAVLLLACESEPLLPLTTSEAEQLQTVATRALQLDLGVENLRPMARAVKGSFTEEYLDDLQGHLGLVAEWLAVADELSNYERLGPSSAMVHFAGLEYDLLRTDLEASARGFGGAVHRATLEGVTAGRAEVDPRLFTEAIKQPDPGRLSIPLRRPGKPMDWTAADSAMPVVTEKVVQILQEIAPNDVQLFPVSVEGRREPYFIANAIHACACVDEERSIDVRRFTKDGIRPDLEGQYEVIGRLVIDPARTGGHKLFRVKDWEVALIASEEIKDAFERGGVVGAAFTPVT